MQNYSSSGQVVGGRGGGVTNSDGVQYGQNEIKKKTHPTSTISHPPEQGDMVLVEFFYLLSPGVMMREVWPATVITEGCLCVCGCGVYCR